MYGEHACEEGSKLAREGRCGSRTVSLDLTPGRAGSGSELVSVPGRNRQFDDSGSCEPNLNRILNGSWAVPVLGGSGPVHPVQVRFFFNLY